MTEDAAATDRDEAEWDDGGGGESCPSRLWTWTLTKLPWTRAERHEYSHANTVMMLKNVMANLSLAMASAEQSHAQKMGEILALLHKQPQTLATKEMARRALQTAKQYEAQRLMWFHMRENVESLKAELMAQRQSLTVFTAFNRANRVMENIASQLNLETLEKTLSVLQENLDSGKEISQLLSTAPVSSADTSDPEELDRELALLVANSEPAASQILEKGKEEAKGGTVPLLQTQGEKRPTSERGVERSGSSIRTPLPS